MKPTLDTRKEQLQKLATKYDFDMNQKLYGIFAYWQQPGCYGCYILTANHDQALKLKKRLVKDNYGDYDARGFCVVYDTAENLMLKYTVVPVQHYGGQGIFPDFLKEFDLFLQRTNSPEEEKAFDYALQLSEMHSTISELNDRFEDLSIAQQIDVHKEIALLQEKIEEFTTNHALDEAESSLEW